VQRSCDFNDQRLSLSTEHHSLKLSADFNHEFDGDYRDIKAFEFVRTELLELARELGEAAAKLNRDVLVERGVAKGLDRRQLELAITVTTRDGIFEEKDGMVGHGRGKINWVLPSVQAKSKTPWKPRSSWLNKVVPIVDDVISRRTDSRQATTNPLDAFENKLSDLGCERFRAWWVQKRHEIKTLDPRLQPVAATVLAAALAEAALAFIVPLAKKQGLMKLLDASKPRTWKFADMVKGARSSAADIQGVLDERTAQRCLDLNDTRQRIHAGFLIDTVASGPIPDLRPEEARDANQTVELLVRKVLDWLESVSRKESANQ
jgi:hypothetical protein